MTDILANIFYLLGIVAITITLIGFIVALIKGWFKIIGSFNKMAKMVIAFMNTILPTILSGMEKQKIVPKGTLEKWTEIVSQDYAFIRSPRQLNKAGQRLLEESGIKKIIDDNINDLLGKLEAQNLKSAFDVERQSFYVLKELENTNLVTPIKNYLYKHPEENINTIFFVGSIYLRNRFLEKHPEITQ